MTFDKVWGRALQVDRLEKRQGSYSIKVIQQSAGSTQHTHPPGGLKHLSHRRLRIPQPLLQQLRAAHRQEVGPTLSRNCLGQQRLAAARGAVEQGAAGSGQAVGCQQGAVSEGEVDQLMQRNLGLLHTGTGRQAGRRGAETMQASG